MIQGENSQSIPLVYSAQNVQSINLVTPKVKPLQVKSHTNSVETVLSVTSGQKQKCKVKSFKLKQHRRGKRKSLKLFNKNFKWIGNNIAGAQSKWASLKRWISIKNPAILSLQETKFQVAGKHKLDGYIIYEHLRSEKTSGGGILMAIMQELSPALVRDGGDCVEALTVDITVKKMQIACTTAYGPQEKDSIDKKSNFWDYLDEEAKRAKKEGKGFILQGDLNSWLGKAYIQKDFRQQNENGKLMASFLERNQLTLVNSLELCKGTFTRIQKRKGICEKSILDFFIVCQRILANVTSMVIDEDKQYILTNYTQVQKGGRAVDSDHVPMEINLDLKLMPTRPTRITMFNFKNVQGRECFKDLTTATTQFTDCFSSMQSLQLQCETWKRTVMSYCERSFPKIRVRTKRIKRSAADKLIQNRNHLKKKQDDKKTSKYEDLNIITMEKQISDIIAEEERSKSYQFKKFCAQNGSVSVSEMWKLKKKLWPKQKESIPTGKTNHQGKLVTSPDEIKTLLSKEYKERLRPRPEHPGFKDIFKIKKEAFEEKMKEAKLNKSPEWTMKELEEVLQDVNPNKSRDPFGINRSIFHTKCIGNNLKESLLLMFNKIKEVGELPSFMKEATITTIPKSGSKMLLKNERGIFILSSVRTILMRLLYQTKYDVINSNMSDSNVGGRRNMSCINHIFVINGIIHETTRSKKNKPVTIQIYDYEQMFDSMDLDEAVSDIFTSGMKDDSLALLYDANKNIKVRVRTPSGLGVEQTFQKLVLQGDTWGPIMAANQVDTFGKQLLEEEPSFIYKYKGTVPVGVLGMIDDLAGISECGIKAKQMNSFINIKTAEKKLQFGPDKCHTLTISHKSVKIEETDLFIDYWSKKHNKKDHIIENFEGKVKMKNVHEQKYLGFIISDDGSNMKNIISKGNRAQGIKKEIQYLIQGLGKYTFESSIIYLNSLLRSTILFAAETMYNIQEKEYRQIERIEEDMLRRIFKTGKGCPIYQLYFEAGQMPARIIIKRMKLIFFQYILKQKEDSLLYTFLMAQKNFPSNGDWFSDILKILNDFEIDISEEDLKNMSKNRFKSIVRQKTEIAGVKYLKTLQKKCEKGARIVYDCLELQDYLNPFSNLKLEDQRFLFSLRCQMNILKSNFSRNKSIIPRYCIESCKKEIDNEHLVYCEKLNENSLLRFEQILNGSISEKKEALNQVFLNEEMRRKEKEPL